MAPKSDGPTASDLAAPIPTGRFELVLIPGEVLLAITEVPGAAGAGDGSEPGVDWPGVGPISAELTTTIPAVLRLGQARADAAVAPWLVRGIVAPDPDTPTGHVVIGHLGGHGPPDEHGAVEIGYTVAEAWRRRGVATECARAWFAWAHGHGATRARLSTTDDNAASLAIAARLGLAPTGRMWDDDDQVWEQVFEGDLPLAAPR